ncbi:hypothetical protein DB29_04361 [Shouchella clausii]|nr:hypothetical protein DB29_04361 [Shouchella clausii]
MSKPIEYTKKIPLSLLIITQIRFFVHGFCWNDVQRKMNQYFC